MRKKVLTTSLAAVVVALISMSSAYAQPGDDGRKVETDLGDSTSGGDKPDAGDAANKDDANTETADKPEGNDGDKPEGDKPEGDKPDDGEGGDEPKGGEEGAQEKDASAVVGGEHRRLGGHNFITPTYFPSAFTNTSFMFYQGFGMEKFRGESILSGDATDARAFAYAQGFLLQIGIVNRVSLDLTADGLVSVGGDINTLL